MDITEPSIKAEITGTAETPAGSIDLSGYPRLTYAPSQWGGGIRIASCGMAVADVAAAAATVDLAATIEDVATELGLTWDELFDALRYGRDKGLP